MFYFVEVILRYHRDMMVVRFFGGLGEVSRPPMSISRLAVDYAILLT
jgi:hypothetical protein